MAAALKITVSAIGFCRKRGVMKYKAKNSALIRIRQGISTGLIEKEAKLQIQAIARNENQTQYERMLHPLP
ncbi:hypothetical protein ACFOLF_31100 [Paenibacillus sepulcri]|uniref:Transposase n=1 Tax=Paenibacillus sepulcri TaxID=359917 RepID=A0ABS7BZW3_9BACL|nr:hypothetical protein [Paenibacillus sepulcri]